MTSTVSRALNGQSFLRNVNASPSDLDLGKSDLNSIVGGKTNVTTIKRKRRTAQLNYMRLLAQT